MSYPGYVYVPYPRWITPKDGSPRKIANSAAEETAITGVLMGEDGKPVDLHEDHPDPPEDYSKPPSVELILSRGYSQGAAERIHAEEQEKFNKGYPPYGKNVEPPLPPTAAPVTPEQIAKLAEIEKSNLDKPPAIVEAGQVEVPPEVIKAGDGW